MELNTERPLLPHEAQRGLLEIAVRMHMMSPQWRDFTHLRCNLHSEEWVLLDADDDGVRAEHPVSMGTMANHVAQKAASVILAGVNYSIARLTVQFSPPKLQIDAVDSENNPLASEVIIDVDVEERVRQELLTNLRDN